MVRNYKRKNENVERTKLVSALRELQRLPVNKHGHRGLSRVARSYGIPTTTLFRQFDNVKNLAFVPDDFQLAKVHHRQVLKFEYENEL